MASSWKKIKSRGRSSSVSDPYFEWAKATNFAYYPELEEPRFHVIIELKSSDPRRPVTAGSFARGHWGGAEPPDGWQHWLRIPPVYLQARGALARSTYCTASVTEEFFEQLAGRRSELSQVVHRFQLGGPVDLSQAPGFASSGGGGSSSNKASGSKRELVFRAIIDDGLAFAHERFRDRNGGTRIECFWDQDDRWGPGVGPGYGRELRKPDVGAIQGIDTYMANATRAGRVDEEEVYRASGHSDYGDVGHKAVNWRTAHGTHVMDLAYGYDPVAAPVPSPIICVQLPARTTADTSGRRLDPFVLHALFYILVRAAELAGGARHRVVVNLSYSVIAPDGYTEVVLVAAIDQLIRLYQGRLAVVLPSGNDHLARCHARFNLAGNGTRELRWRVQPCDATESFMEVFLPTRVGQGGVYPFRVRLRVTTPTGAVSGWITRGNVWQWPSMPSPVCRVDYQASAAVLNRDRIAIQLAPTDTLVAGQAVAPSGIWRIEMENLGPPADIVAWIQRDDSPYGYPRRGRQSRFEDAQYVRFDAVTGREAQIDGAASYVKRAGSINRLATGSHTFVLGGFHRSEQHAAKYSAGGSTVPPAGVVPPVGVLPPFRAGPEAVTASEDSRTRHGVMAAGSRSGSAVAMNGTSVAAPQVARWIAEQWDANLPAGRAQLLALAAIPIVPAPGEAVPPGPERVGQGGINFPPIRPRPPVLR